MCPLALTLFPALSFFLAPAVFPALSFFLRSRSVSRSVFLPSLPLCFSLSFTLCHEAAARTQEEYDLQLNDWHQMKLKPLYVCRSCPVSRSVFVSCSAFFRPEGSVKFSDRDRRNFYITARDSVCKCASLLMCTKKFQWCFIPNQNLGTNLFFALTLYLTLVSFATAIIWFSCWALLCSVPTSSWHLKCWVN